MNRHLLFIIDFLVPLGSVLRRVDGAAPFTAWKSLVFQALPLTFFINWLFNSVNKYGGLLYLLVVVPISIFVHIKLKNYSSRTDITEIILWYIVVIVVGFVGAWGFIGHFFMSDTVAKSIGWAVGSPFQIELSFYHLGLAVAGLLGAWWRGHLWSAVVIIKIIFGYGAAYVHIKDLLLYSNTMPGNAGAPLLSGCIIPTIMLIAWVMWLKENNKAVHRASEGRAS